MSGPSRVIRSAAGGGCWRGVAPAQYKEPDQSHRGMTRHLLLAPTLGDDGLCIDVRYFEVAPGGYSSLERHHHAHAVIVLRGRGWVILDEQASELGAGDCVYVAPDTIHQFRAAPDEGLGFLCIVDSERDPAVAAGDEELARLRANPGIAQLLDSLAG